MLGAGGGEGTAFQSPGATGAMNNVGPGMVLDGKYRIRELIGSGGMGVVYAAERITLGDTVAVKCILSEKNTETNRERFLREAQAAARIRHPNVVQVFDFGSPAGASPYMVMEYLEGPTLAQSLRRAGRFSVEHALAVFARVCSAVQAGHRRGVIHRDIKPGNVIIARTDDGRDAVKVLDFGLARLLTDPELELTTPGMVVGTVSYMAPEQVAGGHVSPATDVFSLAVLLYELVTGKLPFSDANQVAMLFRISQGDFDAPDQHVAALPPGILEAIRLGLALEPSQRPRSPQRLAVLAGVPQADRSQPHDSGTLDVRAGSPTQDSGGTTLSSNSGAHRTTAEGTTMLEVVPRGRLDDRVFVGRAGELAQLHRHLASTTGEAAPVVLVVGEAGVGKTRLVDRLVGQLGADTGVLRGRFFAYEGDRPPDYEALRWLLAGGSSGAGAGAPAMRPGVAPSPEAHAESDKWAAFGELAARFAERARGGKLLLAIDDLQWATARDLEFLAYLPHAARPTPIMVLGTTRPDGSDDLQRWQATLARQRVLRTVFLSPLSPKEQRDWLRGYFGRIRIRPQDARRIHHATSGNPFALLEVVRQLIDSGAIFEGDNGWSCDDLFDVALPDTVHALFAARAESLPEAQRGVLELACVVGEQFRFETLQRAGNFDEIELESALEDAVARRVLSDRDLAPGSDYRFSSEGMRRVLYDGLPPRARRRLHRRVVEALGELYADANDVRRIAHVLAYHHRAVGAWGDALHHALVAACDHLSIHAHDAAQTALVYAREAAEAVAAQDPCAVTPLQHAQLTFVQGTLDARVGRLERGQAQLEQAIALGEKAGDEALVVDALLELGEALLGRGQLAEGVAVGMRGIGAAQAAGDRRREYTARVQVGRCASALGRMDDAEAIIEPVLESTDAQLSTVRAFALREMALVHARRGVFGAAVRAANEALVQARMAGDGLSEYRAASALGFVHTECGHHDVAVGHLERALELARAMSLRRREGLVLGNLGEVHHLAGDTLRGLSLVRASLTIFLEIADRASEGDSRVNLGRMLLSLGRVDEAAQMLEAGRSACAESGRTEYEGMALCALAELRLAQGEWLVAHGLYVEARQVLGQGGGALLWQAELGLARTAAHFGDDQAARRHGVAARGLVDAQLEDLPEGPRAAGLSEARIEILRYAGDDSATLSAR